MPKLLSLNNYNYRRGGSDAMFIDHDRLFSELGWETARFSMHHPLNEPSDWSTYFVDELEFGQQYGVREKALMATKVIYSLEAKRNVNRLLSKFRPDVAHAHCIYHHLSPSVLSALTAQNVPVVMTAHDLKLACPAYKMLNKNGVCEKCKNGNVIHLIKNRCIHDSLITSTLVAFESFSHKVLNLYKRNLSKIIVPSCFYREKLISWGYAEHSIEYIPNYVDTEKYHADFSPGDYFLYFGRLAPEKGVGTLISAVVASKTKLVVAGTGPSDSELREMVPDHIDSIDFRGYVSGSELFDLVRGARAVVLPSEWYENAPVSILEAYACGKPVVGARIGGIPEMIRESETGFLFSSNSAQELAELLSSISSFPEEKLRAMGHQAREYVKTTFTEERYKDSMLALYGSLGAS